MRHPRAIGASRAVAPALLAALLTLACPAQGTTKNVAILIFDGVQIIDSMGPYEVFGHAGWNVYTVAATTQPITTAMGQTLVPRYSFASAPKTDVLVTPGGEINRSLYDPTLMAWIRGQAKGAEVVLSVC